MTNPKDPKNGALYDDLGNLIQAPGGMPFINERGNIEVRKPIDPARVLERNAGCWNCIHQEIGTIYDSRVDRAYTRDVVAYKERGLSDESAHKRAGEVRAILRTKKGLLGICLADKAEGEFIAAKYLCEHWSGRVGASLARAPGEPLSPLVAEEIDKLGDKPPE
jgi:hypothetical protein